MIRNAIRYSIYNECNQSYTGRFKFGNNYVTMCRGYPIQSQVFNTWIFTENHTKTIWIKWIYTLKTLPEAKQGNSLAILKVVMPFLFAIGNVNRLFFSPSYDEILSVKFINISMQYEKRQKKCVTFNIRMSMSASNPLRRLSVSAWIFSSLNCQRY